jgi:poly(A) polymerase
MIHLDNTFGTPAEDAFRRDFTVNALFYSPQTFQVVDYAGGVSDLEARLIRTIGDPELRMREDPVRMMRAVRFAAKLGFEIEPATRTAIERHRKDLAKASVPRLVEETYRTLGQNEAAHALVLMEELGLLEYVIPILSTYLKSRGASLAEQPTVRNMAALGKTIASGFVPDHSMVLAALMLDMFRDGHRDGHVDLLGALRARGFARGDTEQMRLILDAFQNLAAPTRRTRRLMRRPYFPDARMFFEMAAPTYAIDSATTVRFLADPDSFTPPHATQPDGTPAGGKRRRRRRRRRGRGRRGGVQPGSAVHSAAASSDMNGAAHSTPHSSQDPTRRE